MNTQRRRPDPPVSDLDNRSAVAFGPLRPSEPVRPEKLYVVFVVNMSDYAIHQLRVDDGPWIRRQPPIGRTCDVTDAAACLRARRWAPLAYLECGRTHRIEVRVQDAAGKWFAAEIPALHADCAFRGGVVWLRP
ncbi:MAG: hypothetical protein ACE5F1_06500 [Planctomycetota bacterium]